MKHAPLAPSSAARIEACPGSVAMEAPFPDEETDDTRAGDAVHWAGASLLNGDQIAIGQVAENGVTLDAEMVDAAELWAGYILKRKQSPVGRAVEKLVRNGAIHPANYGTPDCRDYAPRHLYIDDLKYGHGYIEVVGNWQLINYAVLTLYEMMGGAWRNSDIDVTMTICQPRSYHRGSFIRSWTVKAFELVPYAEKLAAAFIEALSPYAKVIASDQCKDCKARHDCEASLSSAFHGVDVAYQPVPLKMRPEDKSATLKRLRHAAARITAVMTGLEADIVASIGRGVRVPGFVNESGSGKTVWTVSKEEVLMLGEALGVSFDKPDTITPIQAAAVLKRAKLDPSIVSAYSETTAGGAKLIESSASMAAKAFNEN